MKILSPRNASRASMISRLRSIPAYMQDRNVPFFKKGLIVMAVLYVISPVDALPDVIPLLGWLDDLGVVGLLISGLLRELDRFELSRLIPVETSRNTPRVAAKDIDIPRE